MLPFSKILVFGKNGQLASSFRYHDKKKEIHFIGQDDLNVTDDQAVFKILDAIKPELIINCMAYTKVDLAETDKVACRKLNTDFPFELGKWCEKNQKKLIHFSTDYVFDGSKKGPYLETDVKNPLNVYGQTKSEGEDLLMSLAAEIIIFRISWVYSPYGNNFLKTMLKLGSERESLKIVSDQWGGPCSALDVARSILAWISSERFSQFKKGIYHLTPKDIRISWYDFAKLIFQIAEKHNKMLKIKELIPIKTEEYATPAVRPKNSVLNSEKMSLLLGVQLSDLRLCLDEAIAFLDK